MVRGCFPPEAVFKNMGQELSGPDSSNGLGFQSPQVKTFSVSKTLALSVSVSKMYAGPRAQLTVQMFNLLKKYAYPYPYPYPHAHTHTYTLTPTFTYTFIYAHSYTYIHIFTFTCIPIIEINRLLNRIIFPKGCPCKAKAASWYWDGFLYTLAWNLNRHMHFQVHGIYLHARGPSQ